VSDLRKRSIGQIIEEFAALRDHLAAERKKFKELEANLKADLEALEVRILEEQRKLGLTSLSTKYYTAFQTTKESVKVGNWDSFIHFVADTHNFQLLEKRCAKLACLEQFKDGVQPHDIGLDYEKEVVVQVRKK